eukprot:5566845-Prymnesium_polylepis.2
MHKAALARCVVAVACPPIGVCNLGARRSLEITQARNRWEEETKKKQRVYARKQRREERRKAREAELGTPDTDSSKKKKSKKDRKDKDTSSA